MRQRPGKQSDETDSSPPPPAASSPPEEKTEERKIHVDMAHVIASREQFDQASKSWRAYLFKMTMLVLLLAAHQSQDPMKVCLEDVKEHNAAVEAGIEGETIEVAGAMFQVLRNGMCEWMGIALAAFLGKYLNMEKAATGDFTVWPYMVASTLFSLLLTTYFQTKDGVGCAGRGLGGSGIFDSISPSEAMGDDSNRTRQFPVAAVLHLIVTVSLWCIKYGKDKTEANASKVEIMKMKLDAAKKKAGVKTF